MGVVAPTYTSNKKEKAMNQYHGPSHEEWQNQWNNVYSREADDMVDQAFGEYEEMLKKARAYAIIKTNDPLERAAVSLRSFHLAWAKRLIEMAHVNLVSALNHAEMHRAGN